MLRQYSPPRFRYELIGGTHRAVGTVPVGTIFQPAGDRSRGQKMIVEAWLARRIGAGARVGARHVDMFAARGGHLAKVRDLATGRRSVLADHLILHALDDP